MQKRSSMPWRCIPACWQAAVGPLMLCSRQQRFKSHSALWDPHPSQSMAETCEPCKSSFKSCSAINNQANWTPGTLIPNHLLPPGLSGSIIVRMGMPGSAELPRCCMRLPKCHCMPLSHCIGHALGDGVQDGLIGLFRVFVVLCFFLKFCIFIVFYSGVFYRTKRPSGG